MGVLRNANYKNAETCNYQRVNNLQNTWSNLTYTGYRKVLETYVNKSWDSLWVTNFVVI